MSNVLNKLQIKIRIKVLGFPLHVCSFQEAIVSFPMCAGVLNLSPTTLFFQIILTGVINMFRLFHNTNTFLTQVSFLFFQCISGHILVLSIQHGNVFTTDFDAHNTLSSSLKSVVFTNFGMQ